VLVEKPFTVNAREAREIVALAARRKLVALEAMWTRFLPHMVRLREIVAAGAIGEIRTVLADHNQRLSADPLHRINSPELGGGALLDLGIYPVSFAFDMLGIPTGVQAISSPTATGVDRQTAILLGFAGGKQAVLHAALDTRGPNKAFVIGTGGYVAIEASWYMPVPFTVYDLAGAIVERFDRPVTGRGMQYQAMELERLAEGGLIAGKIMPPEQSVRIMETLDEIRRQIGLAYPSEA